MTLPVPAVVLTLIEAHWDTYQPGDVAVIRNVLTLSWVQPDELPEHLDSPDLDVILTHVEAALDRGDIPTLIEHPGGIAYGFVSLS